MTNQAAIEKTQGPCIILAGAGTGKTYTIVEKIKYLIENKIYLPEKIVCITFSNEAANNLILRIGKILGNEKTPIIRTFHGFSSDLLRKYGDKIGISKEFKILDPDQAKVILHRNLRVTPINCHKYISTIGTAKDLGIKLENFKLYLEKSLKKYDGIDLERKHENLNFELQTLHLRKSGNKKDLISEIKVIRSLLDMKKFITTWTAYEKLKQKGNYLDYSDLNQSSFNLLEKNPEISGDFSYVIVDEFQDTNKLQLDFLIKLASDLNITVVGDINQSIYRFRGAYRENLNLFKKAFSVSEKDIFNLNKSYRSPNTVLRTAHKLISSNYQNKEDLFFVENANGFEGDKVQVFEMKNAKEESRKVIEIINQINGQGTILEDICVLFRAHQHGRIIKKALEHANIPFFAVSKASLLKQKSVKTAIDYLSILSKLKKKVKGAEQSWWDLVYHLDFNNEDLIKIGRAIKEFTRQNKEHDDNGINNGGEILSVFLFNNLGKMPLSNEGKLASRILIDRLKLMLEFIDNPVSMLLKEVYRISGLALSQKTPEEKEIILNLSKFYEIAKTHEELYDADLSSFLYYLSVLEELGIEIDSPQLEEKGVRLMTSHATKGLEFNTVIITNFAQGKFPIERYISNRLIPTELLPEVKEEIKSLGEDEKENFITIFEKHQQLQEERRLAYVSFTRSKEKLFLTFAEEYLGKPSFPSQFLNEISYKSNADIEFFQDNEINLTDLPEKIESFPKFSTALTLNDFPDILDKIVSNGKNNGIEKERKNFSPSALILFSDCQKEFEYRYIFNMPERKTISWDAMRLGSFVHRILEKGVNSGYKSAEDFIQLAKELSFENEWESIDFIQAETLIRVFFERNKTDITKKAKQSISCH